MSLEETDAASRAVQKTPYRIPLAYIESEIHYEHVLTMPPHLSHISLVMLELHNGFVVFGKSVPADPENYDADLGMKFAREDAIRQLWPLFAFALRCDMAEQRVMDDIKGSA
jgi:hypothetical protein